MGLILFAGWYSQELCRQHPDKVFVFGDNAKRFGMGGQAVIRNESNTLGVATKRKPSMTESSFFSESSETDLDTVLSDLSTVWAALKEGKEVVIPVTAAGEVSLGRERAELPERAPSIYKTIVMHVEEMKDVYGSRYIETANGL